MRNKVKEFWHVYDSTVLILYCLCRDNSIVKKIIGTLCIRKKNNFVDRKEFFCIFYDLGISYPRIISMREVFNRLYNERPKLNRNHVYIKSCKYKYCNI